MTAYAKSLVKYLWDWRNEDHNDEIMLTRSQICYLLDYIDELEDYQFGDYS